MTNSKVSIILPFYNMGKVVGELVHEYLDDAISSVLNQTYKNWELIIVDHNSDDPESLKALAKWEKWEDLDNIKIVKCDLPYSLPASRNFGINSYAKGEYIVCLDADDKLHPQYLAKAVEILDADKKHKFGFVTSFVQPFGEESEVYQTPDVNIAQMLSENIATVSSMFRKEAFQKAGGYAEDMSGYQDWNLWISMIDAGYSWFRIPEALFNYRVRKESMVTGSIKKDDILFNQIVDKHTELYKKHSLEIIKSSHKRILELTMLLKDSNREAKNGILSKIINKFK